MDDSSKFLEKMMELGIGMSMIQQMPAMMKDVMQPLGVATTPSIPPSINPIATQSVAQIYLAIDNKQAGPFTENELITLIQNNLFHPETLVWKSGMPNWAPAAQVTDINKLFILSKIE